MPKGFRVMLDKGINFLDPPSDLKPGELTIARNCYYPESGQLTKWPGNALFGAVGAAVTGLEFVKFRTTGAFLLASAGTAYYSAPVGATGSWTSRASGLTAVGQMEAAYYEGTDRAYIMDGVNGMRTINSALTARTSGLTRPSAATLTFLSNSTTTYPNGSTFLYCHAEYDSTNDVESAPSAVVQLASTAANGTFKYTFPTVTNGATDKYRVYRTQHGGQVFYRIAEIASTNTIYYDGDNTDAGSPAVDNDTVWGFKTVDDVFLSVQPIMPMVGEPLRSNYITVNGTIPIGDIFGFFQKSAYVAGVTSFPHHVYYSMPDFPETFSPVNFIPVGSGRGDQITGIGTANDRLIIFTVNGIYRLSQWPLPINPGFSLSQASLEEVTRDHGCVAKRTVCNFGVGQPNNRLFYLSTRGPMMTDGYNSFPIGEKLNWSSSLINFSYLSKCIAKNFPKAQIIVLAVPSVNATSNDMAFVYHYGLGPKGTWTGPLHKRCAAMAVSYDEDTETRLFVADTTSNGNVYLEDTGTTDAQLYDDSGGSIKWEWGTGDQHFGSESALKRHGRVFLNVTGTDDTFAPQFKVGISKRDTEDGIYLKDITQNTAGTLTVGTSSITKPKTRTYRGVVNKTGTHARFHLTETAAAARAVAAMEIEVEPFGQQR